MCSLFVDSSFHGLISLHTAPRLLLISFRPLSCHRRRRPPHTAADATRQAPNTPRFTPSVTPSRRYLAAKNIRAVHAHFIMFDLSRHILLCCLRAVCSRPRFYIVYFSVLPRRLMPPFCLMPAPDDSGSAFRQLPRFPRRRQASALCHRRLLQMSCHRSIFPTSFFKAPHTAAHPAAASQFHVVALRHVASPFRFVATRIAPFALLLSLPTASLPSASLPDARPRFPRFSRLPILPARISLHCLRRPACRPTSFHLTPPPSLILHQDAHRYCALNAVA